MARRRHGELVMRTPHTGYEGKVESIGPATYAHAAYTQRNSKIELPIDK